ncbi:hypothetical protein ACSVC9_12915 [Clostridium sp. LBM24168]
MSETVILAVIGIVGTLAGTVLTQSVNIYIERTKRKENASRDRYETKREKLNGVYKELISVVNLYPNSSPNDILKYVNYAPNYSMEHFETVLKSLDYQIDDYKNQLNINNIDFERKFNIETQISNREYSKKKISEIRHEYYIAREKYKSFCESDKIVFDFYAGQDVRNRLVEFEVVIHNVFISGYRAGEDADPINNIILLSRRNLINNIRSDVGIY